MSMIILNISSDTYLNHNYRCSDLSCCRNLESATDITTPSNTCRSRLSSNSSSDSEYPGELLLEDDGKWHCPPKTIWKGAVEVIIILFLVLFVQRTIFK